MARRLEHFAPSCTPSRVVFLLLALLACACGSQNQELYVEYIEEEIAPGVYGTLFESEEAQTSPSVLMLPGANGALVDYSGHAEWFRERGFNVLLLDYYDAGADLDPSQGVYADDASLTSWVKNAHEGLELLRDLSAGKIALLGFSRGAAVAFQSQPRESGVSALVAYYGIPYEDQVNRTELPRVEDLPPVLMHVGDQDDYLALSEARAIAERLREDSPVELLEYEGAGHGFMIESTGDFGHAGSIESSREATLVFLERELAD